MGRNQRISLQSAFVLHSRPYRETSLLLDIFSCDYGKIALLAKGARRSRAGLASILQPFHPLKLSWSGSTDLQTLTSAEAIPPGICLRGRSLYCGLYMNELLNYFLHRHDPHRNLFSHYAAALVTLAGEGVAEATLRYFEFALLDEIGFGLQIDANAGNRDAIRPDLHYQYRIGRGLVVSGDSIGGISGATLINLANRKLDGPEQMKESKRLMRFLIDHYLEGKPLRSRSLFNCAISKPRNP